MLGAGIVGALVALALAWALGAVVYVSRHPSLTFGVEWPLRGLA